jgi:hypothetical protein
MIHATPPKKFPDVDSKVIDAAALSLGRSLVARTWSAVSERDLQLAILAVVQEDIAATAPGPRVAMRIEREYRLTERDRLDFAVLLDTKTPNILAIEVKVDGSRVATARQILRYAEDERVGGIILATTSARIAAGFHGRIAGKRVYPLVLRRI